MNYMKFNIYNSRPVQVFPTETIKVTKLNKEHINQNKRKKTLAQGRGFYF